MRTDKERAINAPFTLFSIVVDNREKAFTARALGRAAAIEWCDIAHKFNTAFAGAMQNRAVLSEALDLGVEALRAYPMINQIDLVDWDALTTEQIVSAIGTLLDINDPLTHARNRQAEKEAEAGEQMKAMANLGIDAGQITSWQKHLESRSPT